MKIVQIDGIKGLITAGIVCVCAFAGFVLFPGYVGMSLWNKYLAEAYMFPTLSLFQGTLLWAILAISYFIVDKKGFALSFRNTPELSDEELNSILRNARMNSKMNMLNKVITKSDKFIKSNDDNKKPVILKKDEAFVSTPLKSSSVEKEESKSENNVSKVK